MIGWVVGDGGVVLNYNCCFYSGVEADLSHASAYEFDLENVHSVEGICGDRHFIIYCR